MTDEIRCAACFSSVPPDAWNRESGSRCNGCSATLEAWVFPSIRATLRGAAASAVLEASEASCFYHAESRAHAVCDKCGRFVCGLCDLELGRHHYCPACLQSGMAEDALGNLEARRVMWDTAALALAVLPALVIWPTILTGPIALFAAIWWWRRPSSIVPRTKFRFILAIVLALAQIAGWIAVFVAVATKPGTTPSGG